MAQDVRLLLTGEAAAILGVAPQTVRTLALSGGLPCRLTAGGHRRFLEADVLAYRGRVGEGRAPGLNTRAGVWAAAATEVLRAAATDLGADTAEGAAFRSAAETLAADLAGGARAAAPSRPRKGRAAV
jgi:excisionase family DNA binding protein